MKRIVDWIVRGSCLVFASACGSSEATSPGDDGEPLIDPSSSASQASGIEQAEERTLAELNLGGESVAFVELSAAGEKTLMLRSHGNAEAASRLLALSSERGDLTLLETFLALAPRGSAPPEELLQSHLDEARALGRSDASVRKVTIDKGITPPNGESPCLDKFFFFSPLQWFNQIVTAAPGDAFACVTTDIEEVGLGQPSSTTCSHSTTNRMMVGACMARVDGVTQPSVRAFPMSGTPTTWSAGDSVDVNPGEYTRFDLPASSSPHRLAVVVLGSRTNPVAVYGMRSGEAL